MLNVYRYLWIIQIVGGVNVVFFIKFPSMSQKVVILITFGAVNDENFFKLSTFSFH